MTTDFIQYKQLTQLGRMAHNAWLRKKPKVTRTYNPIQHTMRTNKIELTRNTDFLSGTDDIFDVLSKAGDALEDAENTILEQDERIQTLEEISGLDPLTGFLNRRGFTHALMREVARTNRGLNEGGLLVMFNVETLDHIRTQYGDEAADRALTLIARAMENEIRPIDWAGRINDDEFILLFSHTTMEAALGRLQAMALRLNKLSLIWDGAEIHLSLSLGLKSYAKGDKAEDIFFDANADLQRNRKSAGTS